MTVPLQPYKPHNTIRIVTAASLFDGHDAAINVMRRIIQSTGVEVIHLGHNRSALDVVDCAIEEDAQAIALTSYQGGHVEYFKYMFDLLKAKGAGHIKLFGGGGGTILPQEIEELHAYGITRIYSPDDGRSLGLQGMINDLVQKSDFETPITFDSETLLGEVTKKNPVAIAQAISMLERKQLTPPKVESPIPVLGITGTGGAGKSSLTDELILRFLEDFKDKTIGVISVDPSKRKTGGALLGDRIRMNSVSSSRVYMRSFATREANIALNKNVHLAIDLLKMASYDLIIVETAGIGQSDSEITNIADVSLYVMTPEYGAASQLEKIDMVDYADIIALNKFDKRGALDALRDVKKQYQRSHGFWNHKPEDMPVYGTIAAQFNDPGTNALYLAIIETLNQKMQLNWHSSLEIPTASSQKIYIIPPDRTRYLAEIAEESRRNDKFIHEQKTIARKLYQLHGAMEIIAESSSK
jgi:methylmalonyl-CoA mutase